MVSTGVMLLILMFLIIRLQDGIERNERPRILVPRDEHCCNFMARDKNRRCLIYTDEIGEHFCGYDQWTVGCIGT